MKKLFALLLWPSLLSGQVATDTVHITVVDQSISVVVPEPDTTLAVGDTYQLTARPVDANGEAVNAQLTWQSTDAGVLTVDANGLVTTVGVGVASVILTASRILDPPPQDDAVELVVTRLDEGTGTALVSNGIPLRPGDLMPGEEGEIRITTGGIERPIYVEALRGKHPDGSLRSILVQFQYPGDGIGTLEWTGRTLPTLTRQVPVGAPAAVALPSNPNYLVATDITLHPVLPEAALEGSFFDGALEVFRTGSDAHWDAFGADYLLTTNIYDRALNHFTFWAMTGDVKYWHRAVLNAIEARNGSTDDPQNDGVAPRYYQPDGMGMHYLLTGDTVSIDYLMGGIIRTSLLAQHNPTNLSRFGIPPEGYEYNEGRIRARVLLGSLWAWLLEETGTDWGSRADQIVEGMIQGQNADGSLTYRLGTDNTPTSDLRYGQSNYMEGLVMDALVKYHRLRNPDARIVDFVQGMVGFLEGEWDDGERSWHYWSPSSAYDFGDGKVPLDHTDELNTVITIGHYWVDYMRGSTENRTRADAAFTQTFSPSGADFGITWGRKVFNQAFLSAFAQMYYRAGGSS